MLQSRQFINRVLRNPVFTRRVLSMVVDEAHCISHWGADFRKKYGTLGTLRAFLPRGTPVIAMTATLTGRARRDIHSKLQLRGSSFINHGNDRPNVSLVVRACEHSLESYEDLAFVLPATITKLEDVDKTWIYVDNITTGSEIIDYLTNRLRQLCPAAASPGVSCPERIVRPYNAVMSLQYRQAAMDAFRRGEIRIMVCTDAAGMVRNFIVT